MKLYHGSKAGIVGAITLTSRSCCDFGRGFYMGSELAVEDLKNCAKQKREKAEKAK